MATFSVRVNIRGMRTFAGRIRRASKSLAEPKPLANAIAKTVVVANREDRRHGRNVEGQPLPEIKPSTQDARKRAGRGKGKYLNPGPGRDPRLSRTIANFVADVAEAASSRAVVAFGWINMPWLKYHLGRARTNIAGVSPNMAKRIERAVRSYLGRILKS